MKSVVQRKFARYYAEDNRDRRFRQKVPVDTVYRRSYRYWYDDYRWFDQGETPACVGYGWGHWLANDPIRQVINPAGIYCFAQFLDEWQGEDYEGTSVRAGAKALQRLGFISKYSWAFTIDEVINTVLNEGPMVVGTAWYEGMSNPDRNHFIHPTGQLQGGHCYLINGVNIVLERLRIKNSWERDWGDRGRGWITFKEFAGLLADQGEACIATEVKPSDF